MFTQAVKILHENFSKIEGECEVYRKGSLQCKVFIDGVMQIIEEFLHFGMLFDRIYLFIFYWLFSFLNSHAYLR